MSQHRDCLVLSVAWRLLTELFRRHGASHELRLLRCHPGISMAGQLMLLVDPEPQTILHCTRLILNLGGAVGTYEVCVRGAQTADGNFLAPALAGDLAAILDRVEAAMGFTAPTRLPPVDSLHAHHASGLGSSRSIVAGTAGMPHRDRMVRLVQWITHPALGEFHWGRRERPAGKTGHWESGLGVGVPASSSLLSTGRCA